MKAENHAVQNAQGWADSIRQMVAAIECDYDRLEELRSARQRIQEAPLSLMVRSGWVQLDDKMQAEEFEILLSTGGPALRIMGELDEHKQPHRAWLEYQDWGTPWTHHHVEGFAATLLTFCQQFYFGE